MSSYQTMDLCDVRLAEAKALEGLKAILEQGQKDRFGGHRVAASAETLIAAVELDELTAVEALTELLEAEAFKVATKGGFLHLDGWGNEGEGYGKCGSDDVILKGLARVLEPDGTAWVRDEGEGFGEWEYRFSGGSFELGKQPSCWVSDEDRARVGEAMAALEQVAAGPALEVVRAALVRAEFLMK